MKFLLVLLLLATPAYADTVLYYRDSDGVVIGSTTSPNRVNADLELTNYDSGISYLRRAGSVQTGEGKILKVVNNSVVQEDDLEFIARRTSKRNLENLARAKLLVLGLTNDEIGVFIGRD